MARPERFPALGPDAPIPPRAQLETVSVFELDDGQIVVNPLPVKATRPAASPVRLANDESGLRRGWHPVCRSEELLAGESLDVALLGENVTLRRPGWRLGPVADGVFAAADHLGHVWVAPELPSPTCCLRPSSTRKAGSGCRCLGSRVATAWASYSTTSWMPGTSRSCTATRSGPQGRPQSHRIG